MRCPPVRQFFARQEHAQRLLDSAKVYRIDVDFTRDEIVSRHVRA